MIEVEVLEKKCTPTHCLCFHKYCAGSRSVMGRTQPMISVLFPAATRVSQSSELGIEEIEN